MHRRQAAVTIYDGSVEDESRGLRAQRAAITACVLYSLCSIFMTLSNKIILTSFKFNAPTLLLIFQHVFSVVVVRILAFFRVIEVESLRIDVIRKWAPLNVLFVGMLLSGSYSLKYLSVPMVTIFKNFTTIIITCGDWFFFSHSMSLGIVVSLVLMFLGSVVAGFYDLEFVAAGYMWMGLNCAVSAGYVLYMRTATKGTKLSEFGSVYYNNVLSLPLLLPILIYQGVGDLQSFEDWTDPGFIMAAVLSGVFSIGISFTSFWTVKATSPTTYSVVGSLNKIPLTFVSILIFNTTLNLLGSISISIGLMGGVFYSLSKRRMQLMAANKK